MGLRRVDVGVARKEGCRNVGTRRGGMGLVVRAEELAVISLKH